MKNPARKTTRRTSIGDDLIQSMHEALAHARGENKAARITHVETPVEIKAIRMKVRLTQDAFATALGVSVSGLRKWEQGHRQPSGAALTLLRIMDREPEAVVRAIAVEA